MQLVIMSFLRFGRKYVYIGVCGLMTAGQLISAASFSPYIYAIGRFLCGAGVSGFMVRGTTYYYCLKLSANVPMIL